MTATPFESAFGTGRGPGKAENQRIRRERQRAAEAERRRAEHRAALLAVRDSFANHGLPAEVGELWTVGTVTDDGQVTFLLTKGFDVVGVHKGFDVARVHDDRRVFRVEQEAELPPELDDMLPSDAFELRELAAFPWFRLAADSLRLFMDDELLRALLRSITSQDLVWLRVLERKRHRPLNRLIDEKVSVLTDTQMGHLGFVELVKRSHGGHRTPWWRRRDSDIMKCRVRLTADGRRMLKLLDALGPLN